MSKKVEKIINDLFSRERHKATLGIAYHTEGKFIPLPTKFQLVRQSNEYDFVAVKHTELVYDWLTECCDITCQCELAFRLTCGCVVDVLYHSKDMYKLDMSSDGAFTCRSHLAFFQILELL